MSSEELRHKLCRSCTHANGMDNNLCIINKSNNSITMVLEISSLSFILLKGIIKNLQCAECGDCTGARCHPRSRAPCNVTTQ